MRNSERTELVTPRFGTRVVLLVLALAAVLGVGTVALAHSGLGAASPGPGAVVGGDITEIQLRYNRSVTDASGSVTDPNGVVLDTEFVQDGNLNVDIVLDASLSVPGEYAVRHVSTDVEDDDTVEAAYLFTYDPAARAPQLEIVPDDGRSPIVWIVLAGGLLLIAVLAWRLRRSLQRART